MHPAYFETRFRTLAPVPSWPDAFVILTAWATTGEEWAEDDNRAADRRLERALGRLLAGAASDASASLRRITGYSPTTGHAEPGWAVELSFEEACALGERFRQDALYVVRGDDLFVSYCDRRRGLVPVGSFRERLDGAPDRDEPARG